jgi:glucosamine-6-phosphate deaminase
MKAGAALRDPGFTPVERAALAASPAQPAMPADERIPVIVVENFPALGQLAALRFLEWVRANPEGAVSLPTGKTPEHFIKWVRYLLDRWDEPAVRTLLEEGGLESGVRPDLRGLRFVQIDEFYPIDSRQHNSFLNYVRRYYLDGFGMDESRALLMDCSRMGLPAGRTLHEVWPDGCVDLSLRCRDARTPVESLQQSTLLAVDQWCQDYEGRLRGLGGLGFFMGGIGPDGHIGFNVRGSDHRSTTRLTGTNYETQAAAAVDLGGIEVARCRLVVTIGLGSITFNPECVAVILAAGETKAPLVRNAVCSEPSIRFPATALQELPRARFYVTTGAAGALPARRLEVIERGSGIAEQAERAVIDLALSLNKPLTAISRAEAAGDAFVAAVLRRRGGDFASLAGEVRESLIGRVARGAQPPSGKRFLHTEPHHDDLMLGCLPYIVRAGRSVTNEHFFVTLTSGFTAVTNNFVLKQVELLRRFLKDPAFRLLHAEGYFDPDSETGRSRDVWQLLDGLAAASPVMTDEGAARRRLRGLATVYGRLSLEEAAARLDALERTMRASYPGQKDSAEVQRLKGLCREWEAECTWGYFGWNPANVFHLRLGFYTGDVFTEEPTEERDVPPLLEVMRRTRPDVVSVALDPEASGPDTHYKALQTVAGALRAWSRESGRGDIRVLGYRNVWYRFHPAEAGSYVPVSLNMFAIMRSAFMNTFASQRDASFPSHEYDGPFCDLAQRIQAQQYQTVKTCLGREWFHEHPSALIRAARGFVFLKDMSLDEFYAQARQLRRAAENR